VTKTRWPVDPRWEALKQASFAGEPLPRVRREAGVGELARLLDMIKGCSVSVAAQLAYSQFEPFWSALGDMIGPRIEAKGKSFAEIVEERRRRLV
jgi:hypothetical protein